MRQFITISRTISNQEDDYITIHIGTEDGDISVEMSLENFGAAVTGMGRVSVRKVKTFPLPGIIP